jgi:hypothetical protein
LAKDLDSMPHCPFSINTVRSRSNFNGEMPLGREASA